MLKILILEELICNFTQILLILLKTSTIRQQFWRPNDIGNNTDTTV